MDYIKQALDFLRKTKSTLELEYVRTDFPTWDKEQKHDIYKFTLKRGERKYRGEFTTSIVETKRGVRRNPSAYDLLAGMQKYEVGTFENFCDEFGYNDQPLSHYNKVMEIYDAVKTEYFALTSLYNDREMDLLKEIN